MGDVLSNGETSWPIDAIDRRGVVVASSDGLVYVIEHGGRTIRGVVERRGDRIFVHHEGLVHEFDLVTGDVPAKPRVDRGALSPELRAPMTGTVVQVLVREGQDVGELVPVVVVEAMKMEHKVVAPMSARVAKVHVRTGDRVDVGALLVTLDPEGRSA